MIVESYVSGKKRVEICVDEYPENPRDAMATLGTLWCWRRGWALGSRDESSEKSVDPSDYSGWDALYDAIVKQVKPVVILPVFMYEHGLVRLRTSSFSCPWDSGQIGFIFARRSALEDFGAKIATKRVKERIEKALVAELQTYEAYLNGDVYYFRVLEDGVLTDSCGGYYGRDEIPYMVETALGAEEAKVATLEQ